MKLTIPRADLHPALVAVKSIVAARNMVPILANVALEAGIEPDGAGWLQIVATDLDIEARIRVAADVVEPGATTVAAHRLADMVGKLPKETMIEIDAGAGAAGTLHLRSGRSRVVLQVLPTIDFPFFSAETYPTGFDLAADLLAEAIEATSFAISTEETRYYLNGIYLHVAEGPLGASLIAVATDGHRLAKWARPAPSGAEGMPGVIVPRKTVSEFLKLTKGEARPARVEVSEAKIRLTLGATVLTSRLIDGTFPDYHRVIPSTSETLVTLDRAALAASLDRVQTVLSARGGGVKFSFSEKCLVLTGVNPDAGSATEEMATESDDAPEIDVGFNARYALDLLASFACDRIEIGLTDPGSPTLFRPANPSATAAERLAVLMPMRV